MQVIAKLKHLRIAPRKLRLVADLIRGKEVVKAQAELSFLNKRGARPFLGLLNSAVANARNNFQLDGKNLYLAKVLVDEGPKLKRWRPRARGRASPIQKKTSHLTIVLDLKRGVAEKKARKPEVLKKEELKAKPRIAKEKIMSDKPRLKAEPAKPKTPAGAKRFFRRKAF